MMGLIRWKKKEEGEDIRDFSSSSEEERESVHFLDEL